MRLPEILLAASALGLWACAEPTLNPLNACHSRSCPVALVECDPASDECGGSESCPCSNAGADAASNGSNGHPGPADPPELVPAPRCRLRPGSDAPPRPAEPSELEIAWAVAESGPDFNRPRGIAATPEGDLYVWLDRYSKNEWLIRKYTGQGQLLWERTFVPDSLDGDGPLVSPNGHVYLLSDSGRLTHFDPAGNALPRRQLCTQCWIGRNQLSFDANERILLLREDRLTLFRRDLAPEWVLHGFITAAKFTPSGEILIAGAGVVSRNETPSFDLGSSFAIAKLAANGTPGWRHELGGNPRLEGPIELFSTADTFLLVPAFWGSLEWGGQTLEQDRGAGKFPALRTVLLGGTLDGCETWVGSSPAQPGSFSNASPGPSGFSFAVDGGCNSLVAGRLDARANLAATATVTSPTCDRDPAWGATHFPYSVVMPNGDVVVGGTYAGPMDFGPAGVVTSNGADAFLLRLRPKAP